MNNKNRAIIIVGKEGTDKITKAKEYTSDNPIIVYANEYDIEDNLSIPADVGIIIRECNYKPNIDLIRKIISMMGKEESMIEYVKDRPGHDRRYSTSINKISANLSWRPKFDIDEGLKKTIDWYESNQN